MAGQWIRLVACALLATNFGCNRNAVQQPSLMPSGEKPSLIQQAFGNKPGFVPQAPPPDAPIVRETRKPGQGLKADTELALAQSDIEVATQELPEQPAESGSSTRPLSQIEKDRLLDSARNRYQRVLESDPKNIAAKVGLARLYMISGNKERAIATLQNALREQPNQHGLAYQLAQVHVKFGDWVSATEAMKQALAYDPENRIYTKTLGFCYAHSGQWEEAFKVLQPVMGEAQARFFLGRVLIDRGEVDHGRQQIQQASAIDPSYAQSRDYLRELDTGVKNQSPIKLADFETPNAAPNR